MLSNRDEKVFLKLRFSLYDLYDHALAQEPLFRGSRNLQHLEFITLFLSQLYL